MTTKEFRTFNPEATILGYQSGFVYVLVGEDVHRGDYADYSAFRWHCSKNAFPSYLKAYGPLSDENGVELPNITGE